MCNYNPVEPFSQDEYAVHNDRELRNLDAGRGSGGGGDIPGGCSVFLYVLVSFWRFCFSRPFFFEVATIPTNALEWGYSKIRNRIRSRKQDDETRDGIRGYETGGPVHANKGGYYGRNIERTSGDRGKIDNKEFRQISKQNRINVGGGNEEKGDVHYEIRSDELEAFNWAAFEMRRAFNVPIRAFIARKQGL